MTRPELARRVASLDKMDAGYHKALFARWLDHAPDDAELQAIQSRVEGGETVRAAAENVLSALPAPGGES